MSGLIGGAIALGLGVWWKSRQSAELRRAREEMSETHKVTVYLANFLCFAGLVSSLLFYKYGGYENNSWTPLGLGAGGGCVAALLTLLILPLVTGRSIKHAFIPFAQSEGGPVFLTFGIMGAGVVGFLFALAGLFMR